MFTKIELREAVQQFDEAVAVIKEMLQQYEETGEWSCVVKIASVFSGRLNSLRKYRNHITAARPDEVRQLIDSLQRADELVVLRHRSTDQSLSDERRIVTNKLQIYYAVALCIGYLCEIERPHQELKAKSEQLLVALFRPENPLFSPDEPFPGTTPKFNLEAFLGELRLS